MKTAKILKKSVLTPGNNWISLLNSANLSKKNAVTPVNFHLYHYAGNNPVRYTDPDGRNSGMPPDKEQEMKQRDVCVNGKTTAACGLTSEAQRIMGAQSACSHGTTSEIRKTIADNTKRTDKDGIYAVKTGYVYLIRSEEKGNPSTDYGNTVIIQQSDGIFLQYAHLSIINCKEGELVNEGKQIGVMGDTGNGIPKPNKHLHISAYPESAKDKFWSSNATIDPMDVIRQGTYPCNRKVSGLFHQIYTYTKKDGTTSSYPHEGLDCSGKDVNLIKGWNKGLNGQEALNAQGY